MTSKTLITGNIRTHAWVRETVIRRGAYEMWVSASPIKGTHLGRKQKLQAIDLKLEVKGALAADLYAAGWHTERIEWGGSQQVLWWPPR